MESTVKSARTTVLVYVNGQRREIAGEATLQTLLSYLRYVERLTGAKLGCGEGGCGACTVMLSTYDSETRRIHHRAVNACLVIVAACDGTAITTIEAVGNRNGRLAPVQEALANAHGSQCGFCTPGIIMSMFTLMREHAADPEKVSTPLNEADVESNFDGNLCRCTGYRPILDAFKGLVKRENSENKLCAMGDKCCKANDNGSSSFNGSTESGVDGAKQPDLGHPNGRAKCIDREYVFPPELLSYTPCELNLHDGKWLRPVSLSRLQELRVKFPEAKIIVGNTELGVEIKFKALKIPIFLCATNIPELTHISETNSGVRIGASVTWTQLNSYIRAATEKRQSRDFLSGKSYQLSSLKAIQKQLRWFAGKQIRNVAAVGGNIVTASPISDVNPLWMAAGAQFILLDCRTGNERIVPARTFFLSYRRVDMGTSEILLSILVPWNESHFDVTHAFKVSRRHEDDIAIVSAGVRLQLRREPLADGGEVAARYRISLATVCLGGLAPKTVAVDEVESILRGRLFDATTLQKGLELMARSAELPRDVPGGMPAYRQSLAVGFLFKAFVTSATIVDSYNISTGLYQTPVLMNALGLPNDTPNLADTAEYVSSGVQIVSENSQGSKKDHIGRSIKHLSANLQVSGEAKYLDDLTPFSGELQAALVLSSEAHAKILSIDYSEAEQMEGVCRVVRYKDVRGENMIGPGNDEFCFANGEVTVDGQVIAIVTAETLQQAKDAARAVRVTYEPLPAIVTIEDAIAGDSYAKGVPEHRIERGNAEVLIQKAREGNRVVEGSVRIGAQEHWYLEPHGTIAIPDENGEMMILSSTQTPSKTQATVAGVLGEPMHKVVCKVKRLGGGFGGKETRSFFISAAAAVAAQVTSRPVRLILDRDTDMLTTGTRHAFLAKYIAAYEADGRITALDLKIFLNMGNSTDLSIPVLDRSLYHAQNCYDIPNVRFVGKACFTNTASSTAFRGFGGPQGMMIAENVIEHVAWASRQSAVTVRNLNLYGKHGNSSETPFGMRFDASPLVKCWDDVIRDSQYSDRRNAVDTFNTGNEYRKRGISAIPTMFGISFTFKTYNQAGALVHIFHQDGSVLVSHGGVEMGQGLHTKMCQVAATELGVPFDKVFISETATDKVPNASPTAASASSDMYGMAVKTACRALLKNLEPFRSGADGEQSWEELVHRAWFNRVSLSATGFYRTPTLDQLDLGIPGSKGRPFFYYTNGAAVTEVEVDTLTGETEVLRTDIVMDVGRPLNPAIDVGQIEGAFIQGLGWCTMEEVVRGSSSSHRWIKVGKTHTLGPGTYKIPGFRDIPRDFRVRVLDGRCEQDTIHSSKAIGEPPLFLAASAFFAIRDAITASHRVHGSHKWVEIDSPASVERIRMACLNSVVDTVLPKRDVRPSLSL